MEQRDYLMRHVEQLGVVLGKILSKLLNIKDNGIEVVDTVNQCFKEELGLDISQLNDIDDDKLLDALKTEKQFDSESLERLADILLFVAENVDLEEKDRLYKKCSLIYEYLDESKKIYSFDRYLKMERLKEYIAAIK